MMRVNERAEPAGSAAPTGTRPEGARDEREAQRQVREMFSRIAPRYDFLNHFLSLSFDRLWRRRTAESSTWAMRQPGTRILDVCCGTGDLGFALDRVREKRLCHAAGTRRPIVGCDFAEPMLGRARTKAARGGRRVDFASADALQLPFRDASFDLVTTAFGFRNLANYERGLGEFARVLRRGGELRILEFTEPKNGMLAALYRFYLSRILPRIGGAISGSSAAYSYLPESVRKFPTPEALKEMMERTGFKKVRLERWTCGIVALHRGVRE
ncbi:MAG TPA: bifunctional demethylmenaquinone methyltransferase/2-methoxy-6-polyprenyl-1,4-benzoquinol methylase UbiE [Candidatus Acidoferrales bacterium]|nr:bifunctional demethylmenaquinone methyltransferase/2-methoxy-6-polyprenyl-1,4-benzoquinol methylase UbiE [Candidatus Acidoferrales bacterium]